MQTITMSLSLPVDGDMAERLALIARAVSLPSRAKIDPTTRCPECAHVFTPEYEALPGALRCCPEAAVAWDCERERAKP